MKKFNTTTIIEKLANRGLDATLQEVNKNGVTKTAVVIREAGNNVASAIYLDGLESETDPEAAEEIFNIYNSLKKPEFDIDFIHSYEAAKNKIKLSICGKGRAGVPSVAKLDLEVYARVYVDTDASAKVTAEMLKMWDKTIEEVVADAEQNTFEDVNSFSMAEFIERQTGMKVDEMPMMIISNTENVNGAIQICNTELLSGIADKFENDLYILPSSIHECIVLPAEGNILSFAEMVKEVNSTQVAPEEQLSNSVYKFDRKEKRLTIAQ